MYVDLVMFMLDGFFLCDSAPNYTQFILWVIHTQQTKRPFITAEV
jgi:hypothetical protein